MPSAMAHRPQPVIMPATKATAPIVASATGGQGSASWIAEVEISAREKPKARVRAFTRQGEGRSEMLAAMAPSVTGCPAAKPKIAEAAIAITSTPAPDAHAVDDVLADQHPGEIGQAPTSHRAERQGWPARRKRLDRVRGGRVQPGAAPLDETDKLADHFRRPIRAQMRRGSRRRLRRRACAA